MPASSSGARRITSTGTAQGQYSIALGASAKATGSFAIASGFEASAAGANTVALGAQASTAGNLGTSSVDLTALSGLGGRVSTLEDRTVALERAGRQANGGIAAAMAMGGTIMPPDSNFAVSFNLSTYRGEQGFSGAVVARVSEQVYVSGGFAGSTVRGSTGGRVGVTFGF